MPYIPYIPPTSPYSMVCEIETASLDELMSFALEKDYALGAKGFELDGEYYIAILTQPFYTKSERTSARLNLEEELNAVSCGKKVYVSFDLTSFRKIKDGISDETKSKLALAIRSY